MTHPLVKLIAATVLLASAGVRAEDRAAAREHHRRATTLYDLRRYHEAAKEYEAAYEAKEDTRLLFNAAQAYRLGGEYGDAVGLYKSYLRREQSATNRKQVEALIEECLQLQRKQEELDRQKRESSDKPPSDALPIAPAATVDEAAVRAEAEAKARAEATEVKARAAAATEATQRRSRMRYAGIGVGAAGLAMVGAGIALVFLAKSAGDEITHPTPGQMFDPALESRGLAFDGAGIAAIAVGGVAIAGGVTLILLGREPKQEKVSFRPALGPGYAGASLGVRF